MKVNLPVKFIGTYNFTLIHADGSSEKFVTHNTACAAIRNTQFKSSLSLGSGTGTPAFTDSKLFSYLWNVAASSVSSVKNVGDNGASITMKYELPATSSYVGTITEVGLGANGSIWTHALLTDAEGNPISIVKTDTDLLTVDVTVELYITSTFPLVHGLSSWCKSSTTEITLAALLLATIVSATAYRNLTGYGSYYVPWKVLSVVPKNLLTRGFSYTVGGSSPSTTAVAGLFPAYVAWGDDSTNKRSTLTGNFRHTTEGYNGHYYRYLQFMWGAEDTQYMREDFVVYAIAMGMDLMNPDVFSPQAFTGVTVATGDGATTDFACPLNYFQKDTDVLYKNGVALTRGVDYTIENCANKDKLPELMYWTVTDPEAIKITGGAKTTKMQFAPENYSGAYNSSKACTSFDADTPLHIDWGEARKCNRLYGNLYRYYTSEIIVEYSNNDIDWTPVATESIATSSSANAWLDLSWNTIEARYWRIRVTKYGTSTSTAHYAYFNSSADFFGYCNPTGIHFTEAPAEGDLITMDCLSDIPFKNENFVFNLSLDITLSFA